jgi:glycosyltransferase involved in cell wall biosynthesis
VHSLHALHPLDWLQRSGALSAYPWVATMTGTDYSTPAAPGIVQKLAAARALVVFHAEAFASVRERFPGLADRLHIIAQAVQAAGRNRVSREEARRTWDLAPDDIVFSMAAGLRPEKNIGYALKAFALFRQAHPRSRLFLAGPRLDENESARILAAAEGLDGFCYPGELPHDRVLELMQASDVFLNTSLQEGMSGAVMEAMAAGLAVIATDVAGNRALVDHGRTGMLVPLHEPGALSQALAMLAPDSDLRQRLGRAARQDMLTRFGCAAELQAHEALYARVIAQ